MTDKTGGPAFPMYCDDHRDFAAVFGSGYGGMTMRDFFMAHAPKEIPDWFEPQGMRDRPDTTLWEDIKGSLGFSPLSLRVWCRENEYLRISQWPAYWADAMLAEREEDHG